MSARNEPDTGNASPRPSRSRLRHAAAGVMLLVIVISAVWSTRPTKTGDLTISTSRFTAIVPASRERDAREMLDHLEEESAKLEGIFGLTSIDRPSVYLYEGRDYPSSIEWHVGQYSRAGNSIHVSLDPRGSGIPRDGMKMVAVHEYTHFLTEQRGGSRIPTWIREGIAQYFAGQYKSFNENMPLDRKIQVSASFVPLNEVSTSQNVRVAYAESAFVVAYMAQAEGEDSLIRLLVSLSSGKSVKDSLQDIYSVDEDALVEKTREWIGEPK